MRAFLILTLIVACTADEPADEYDEDPTEDVVDPEPDPEGEPDPEPGAGATCIEYVTTHLQASMQHTDSLAERRMAIDRAFANGDGVSPDTITWTEIETQAQIDRIQTRAGWATYWPHKPGGAPVVHPANAVPISWRTSVYELVSGTTVRSSNGLARVSPHRYVTRVRLRHKASGASVVRVAHHAVSGVDNPQDHVDYRLATHAQNIASFNARMLEGSFPVIGAGDFNTTRFRTLLRGENDGAQPFVFDVPATGGSHGNRLIDYVVRRTSDKNVYVQTGVKFVDLAPSDHRGVRARYTYRPPPCVP
jgi:hypothetical protein